MYVALCRGRGAIHNIIVERTLCRYAKMENLMCGAHVQIEVNVDIP